MEFPPCLFPRFYAEGPSVTEATRRPSVLGWGELSNVQASHEGHLRTSHGFVPSVSRTAEKWIPAEPAPVPLLPPNTGCGFQAVTEPDLLYSYKRPFSEDTKLRVPGKRLDFSKQISVFSWDHRDTAFQTMGRLLEPHVHLGDRYLRRKHRTDNLRMTYLLQHLRNVPLQDCPFSYSTSQLRSLSFRTCDWLQDMPPRMMAKLTHEAMLGDWHQLRFPERVTGGSMSWIPYSEDGVGCLVLPRGAAMNQLHFQPVSLVDEKMMKVLGDPAVFDLAAQVLQVSAGSSTCSEEDVRLVGCTARCSDPSLAFTLTSRPSSAPVLVYRVEHTLLEGLLQPVAWERQAVCVGVRSLYHLASWSFCPRRPPRAQQVIQTRSPSTCINVSPHLPGELSVCTESGTLYLWNLETGLQRLRQDTDTLYFHEDSKWRWSDFTCHPRLLTYADRTGVQAADTRVPGAEGMDLFRIGEEAGCQRWERVVFPRCLRETDPAHFLVATQFSVYIMDERFPVVPLVKWNHMLESPPVFTSVIPGTGRSNKILLGCSRTQETTVLQYTGGTTSMCQLLLPARLLPRVSESLEHLPLLLPHQQDCVTERLASPMAGLAAARNPPDSESMTVFHLTEVGDVFVQKLVHIRGSQKRMTSSQGRVLETNASTPEADTPGLIPDERPPTTAGELQEPSTTRNASEERSLASGPERPNNATPASRLTQALSLEASPHHQPEDSDLELEASEPALIHHMTGTQPVQPRATQINPSLNTKSSISFKRWVRDLLQDESNGKEEQHQRPRIQINKLLNALGVVTPSQDSANLRGKLCENMKRRALVHIEPPEPDPPLEEVCTQRWKDPLSQRLTAAWEGQLGLWWDNHLGLNQESKVQSLRKRRHIEKLKRARSQSALSGSLATSISFDLDPFECDTSSPWSDSLCFSDHEMSSSSFSRTQAVSSASPGLVSCVSMDANEDQGVGATRGDLSYHVSQNPSLSMKTPISSTLLSSQSLRSKGIPRERTRTVRDFLSFLNDSSDPPVPSASSCPVQLLLNSQTLSLSQSSQPSRKRSRMGF